VEVKYYNEIHKLIISGIKEELPQQCLESIIAPTCIMDNQAEFSVAHQEKPTQYGTSIQSNKTTC
jgi:hypothetical protein